MIKIVLNWPVFVPIMYFCNIFYIFVFNYLNFRFLVFIVLGTNSIFTLPRKKVNYYTTMGEEKPLMLLKAAKAVQKANEKRRK